MNYWFSMYCGLICCPLLFWNVRNFECLKRVKSFAKVDIPLLAIWESGEELNVDVRTRIIVDTHKN